MLFLSGKKNEIQEMEIRNGIEEMEIRFCYDVLLFQFCDHISPILQCPDMSGRRNFPRFEKKKLR